MDQGNASARSNLFDAAREARVWTPLFRTISPTPLRCMSVMVLYGSRGVTVRGGRFRSKERIIERTSMQYLYSILCYANSPYEAVIHSSSSDSLLVFA